MCKKINQQLLFPVGKFYLSTSNDSSMAGVTPRTPEVAQRSVKRYFVGVNPIKLQPESYKTLFLIYDKISTRWNIHLVLKMAFYSVVVVRGNFYSIVPVVAQAKRVLTVSVCGCVR